MAGRALPAAAAAVFVVVVASLLSGGDGPPSASANPLGDVVSLAAGGSHTCVLTNAGAVKCWGSNLYGALGDGTTSNRTAAVDVTGFGRVNIAAIAGGDAHTCALTSTGGVKCWGNDGVGQLGGPASESCASFTCSTTPIDVCANAACIADLGGITAIDAGGSHTCAVTTGGGVKCWGVNDEDQLGATSSDTCAASTPCSTTPLDVPGLTGVAAVALGYQHSCALLTTGRVKCWGYNFAGQLGDGASGIGAGSATPVDVCATGATSPCTPGSGNVLTGVTAITAGLHHTCALVASGGVKCWGRNNKGQLGDGTTSTRDTPVDVCASGSGAGCAGGSALTGVDGVAAGGWSLGSIPEHTCAVIASGGVKCWGATDNGQLGVGLDDNSGSYPNPMTVCASGAGASCTGGSALTGMATVAAGAIHTCGVTTTGGVKCWGANGSGQLGDGTTTQRNNPVTTGIDKAPDYDSDGCTDIEENGADPAFGGGRDPANFWDFFDTPDPSNMRDRAITIADVFRVVGRFGLTGSTFIDPLSAPPAMGYHTAFDRNAVPGKLSGPANGVVSTTDIVLSVAQFGHTCIPPP